MDSVPRELRIYVKTDGSVPFAEWLDALRDSMVRQRIRARLKRIELGNFGDTKPVGEGVSELRLDFGPGYRVYLAADTKEIILLLSGGSKKTQDWDIITAKAYWADYRSRRDAAKH